MIELITSIYNEDEKDYPFLNELKTLFTNKPDKLKKIRSVYDILELPDFVYSSEKIILYEYFKNIDIGNKPLLKKSEKYSVLYTLLNLHTKFYFIFKGNRWM